MSKKKKKNSAGMARGKILLGFLSIFFSLYYLVDIPFNLQNDVVVNALNPELFLKGVYHVSLRQKIQYFILGGYFQYFLIEFIRFIKAFWLIPYILRLPSAIFFIFGSIFWYKILKLFNFSKPAIFAFFIVLVTSPTYIWYSHHIPLVAGYFFYASMGMYFLFKYLKNLHNLKPLFFAILAFIFASYTHGLSLVLGTLIFVLSFIYFIFAKKNFINVFFQTIFKNKFKVVLSLVILGVAFYPFVSGFFGTDITLSNRPLLITYLIKYKEYGQLLDQTIVKIISYLHPASLIYAGKILPTWYTQKYNTVMYKGVVEHTDMQWWFNGIAPFGYIGALAYLAIFLAMYRFLKKKDKKSGLFLLIFILYILVPLVANYDNPSIAKTIPVITFIPLAVTLFVELANEIKEKILLFSLFCLIGVNTILNLSYMYSPNIKAKETQPYDTHFYQEVLPDIAPYIDFAKTKIYILQPEDPKVTAAFALYYSPGFVYHIYWVKSLNNIQLNSEDIVIAREPVDFKNGKLFKKYERDGILKPLFVYFNRDNPKGGDKVYLSPALIRSECNPYSVAYVNEFLVNPLSPNEYSFRVFNNYRYIDISRLGSTANLSINYVITDNLGEIIRLPKVIKSSLDEDFININLYDLNKGTYLLGFDYKCSGFADIKFWCINPQSSMPYSVFPLNPLEGSYKTVLRVNKKTSQVICTLNLNNKHLNLQKYLHPVTLKVENFFAKKLSASVDLGCKMVENLSAQESESEMFIKFSRPNLYSITGESPHGTRSMVLNLPLDKVENHWLKVEGGTPTIVNFSALGIQIGQKTDHIKIQNFAVLWGALVFLLWLFWLTFWILCE